MIGNKQANPLRRANQDWEYNLETALALGISLGLMFGLLLGNIAIGISVGLLLATLDSAYREKKQGKRGASIAIAICAAALAFVAVIWLLSA